MKIALIGAGNVAWHIGPALKQQGHEIIAVYSQTKRSAEALAKKLKSGPVTDIKLIPENAGLYIVALQDKAISSVLKQLKFIPACIAHTSGSVSLDVFPGKFRNAGVLYPLQSFSKNRKLKTSEIPFLIESRNIATKKLLQKLARSLSGSVHIITTEKRKQIHLAAVFANNFVNHMYSVSSEILKENKLPFDLLIPLILETASKIQHNSPDEMQTGPARRNDRKIIQDHLKLLKNDPQLKAIYTLLNKSILNKFKDGN